MPAKKQTTCESKKKNINQKTEQIPTVIIMHH